MTFHSSKRVNVSTGATLIRECNATVPALCSSTLVIPPHLLPLLREGLDSQHHARMAFLSQAHESDAEQEGKRVRVELLRAQQARRVEHIQMDQIGSQQTTRLLEDIAMAVRERRTALDPDGYEAFLFSNGDVYEGSWKNCLLHGKGSLIRASTQNVYEGQWFLGQRCGTGTLYSPDYQTLYSGAWLDNKRHGRGELIEPEGIYVGEFINNHISGYGEYTYYDGHVYKGEWRDGLFEGAGTYLYPSGSRYEGSWRAGYEQGRGTKLFFNGDVYVGDWVMGRRHGHGVYTGHFFQYKGSWAYDNMSGTGTCVFEDGTTYTGEWDRGLFHGEGHFQASTEAGGASYTGQFWHGKRHGHGKYVQTSAAMAVDYDGEWCDGEKQGVGVLKGSGCGVYKGCWHLGKPIRDTDDALMAEYGLSKMERGRFDTKGQEETQNSSTFTSPEVGSTGRSRCEGSSIRNIQKLLLNLPSN